MLKSALCDFTKGSGSMRDYQQLYAIIISGTHLHMIPNMVGTGEQFLEKSENQCFFCFFGFAQGWKHSIFIVLLVCFGCNKSSSG